MSSFGWKGAVCGVLLGLSLACASRPEAPSLPGPDSTSDATTFTVFSDGHGPLLFPTPEAKVEKPPPEPRRPRPGLDKRYPPPIPPRAPLAPRPPPIEPRYSLEPPPSKVKIYPDFKVDKLGLWKCDRYTEQYLLCINRRVPRDQDEAMAKALAKKVQAWKAKAQTEAGREQVVKECEAALAHSKKAMRPYQCVWN